MEIEGAQNQDFRYIPRMLPVIEGERVLDLGCGIGLYTAELARQGARVVALDIGIEGVRTARDKVGVDAAHWVCADAAHLPFLDEVCSLVLSIEVLTHLPVDKRRKTLCEVRRIIRADGHLVLSLHNSQRMSFARWLRLQRSRDIYKTNNLPVWPTTLRKAVVLASECGLSDMGGARYLNYHSRFSVNFLRRYPRGARLLMAVENVMAQIPIVRLLAITFVLRLKPKTDIIDR
jgi:SAM-dependent methyltransferase